VRTYHTGLLRKRIFPVALSGSDKSDTLLSGEETATLPDEVALSPVSDGQPPARTRSAGKLLTRLEGFGLALLRLDQVQAAQDGKLHIQSDDGKVRAVPWRPDWWPEPPAPDMEAASEQE
jgi:folate-binding Fe-S cluster repair protein YgfZ